LDSISSGLVSELEVTMRDIDNADQQSHVAHKLPLEICAFLLHWFLSAAEKVKQFEGDGPPAAAKKKGRWGRDWRETRRTSGCETFSQVDQIPAALGDTSKVFRLKMQRICTAAAEPNGFAKCAAVFFYCIVLTCPNHSCLVRVSPATPLINHAKSAILQTLI
jgi:condensin complex subunit 1